MFFTARLSGNHFFRKAYFTSRKMITKDKHIYLLPQNSHKSTLIWLHGLGDSAEGYLPIFHDQNFPIQLTDPSTKIILLTAPNRKMSKYEGYEMTSWFDMKTSDWIYQFNKQPLENSIGVDEANESRDFIHHIISEELKTIDAKKIVIGGFSQGCCMALHSGLTFPKQLGGILAYSGFLFPISKPNQHSVNIDILISHGKLDPVLPWRFAQKTYETLKDHQGKVEMIPIDDLEHTFSIKSFELMQQFLKDHLK